MDFVFVKVIISEYVRQLSLRRTCLPFIRPFYQLLVKIMSNSLIRSVLALVLTKDNSSVAIWKETTGKYVHSLSFAEND